MSLENGSTSDTGRGNPASVLLRDMPHLAILTRQVVQRDVPGRIGPRHAVPVQSTIEVVNSPTHLILLHARAPQDRKSTRLNSSHTVISYAVFCLKKKITKSTVELPWYSSLLRLRPP